MIFMGRVLGLVDSENLSNRTIEKKGHRLSSDVYERIDPIMADEIDIQKHKHKYRYI